MVRPLPHLVVHSAGYLIKAQLKAFQNIATQQKPKGVFTHFLWLPGTTVGERVCLYVLALWRQLMRI